MAGFPRSPPHQPGPVTQRQPRPGVCLWPNTQHSPQAAGTQACPPVPASSCSARNASSHFTQSASSHASKKFKGHLLQEALPDHTPTFPAAPSVSRADSVSSAHSPTAGSCLQTSDRRKLLGGRTLHCKAALRAWTHDWLRKEPPCTILLGAVRGVPETTPGAAAGSEDTTRSAGELAAAPGPLFQTLSSTKNPSERPTLFPRALPALLHQAWEVPLQTESQGAIEPRV